MLGRAWLRWRGASTAADRAAADVRGVLGGIFVMEAGFPFQKGGAGRTFRGFWGRGGGKQPSDSPLCGGSPLEESRAKPPLKGEVPAICGRRGSSPHAAKVAAALSAAVTTTKSIGDRFYFQAERPMQKQIRQTPAALREGARGRGFSQRSRLPRITSPLV